jgi:hypothetical protein
MIKLRRMRWAGHVSHITEECMQVLVRKPEDKRPLERSRHRWEVTIKIGVKET